MEISVDHQRQCAGNGRGRHDQLVRESAFVRQQRTLCHAEPVLLVCDDQSQLPELHLFLENGVGSHQHFQCSVFQLLIERPFLFGTDGTGEQSD